MKDEGLLVPIRGRGAMANPPSRFEPIAFEPDAESLGQPERPRTRYYRDSARAIIARNDSPDVGFGYSINPYRGCEHGCAYCYARPTHEYLGLSAGLDFESRIFIKEDAPVLLRHELSSPSWKPRTIALSGVTDPYQPIERRAQLTRRCLQVLAEFGNPAAIITKNYLVARDKDVLADLASKSAAAVNLSITTLDETLQRAMEPRTSIPRRRMNAISELASAGIPVGVMVAPVIPGLTDHELPAILAAAADAGASWAGFIPLRLPHAVASLFADWLAVHLPGRRDKVLGRIRGVRGGRLNDPRFGSRMCGEGPYADQLNRLFRAACGKYGLSTSPATLSVDGWRGNAVGGESKNGQLSLFTS